MKRYEIWKLTAEMQKKTGTRNLEAVQNFVKTLNIFFWFDISRSRTR
jgi:hypothetical protein